MRNLDVLLRAQRPLGDRRLGCTVEPWGGAFSELSEEEAAL